MNPRVADVKPLPDFRLQLVFRNGEKRIFDAKPWLEKEIFRPLTNVDFFNKAKVNYGTVSWDEDLDFSPDTLYLESISDF